MNFDESINSTRSYKFTDEMHSKLGDYIMKLMHEHVQDKPSTRFLDSDKLYYYRLEYLFPIEDPDTCAYLESIPYDNEREESTRNFSDKLDADFLKNFPV